MTENLNEPEKSNGPENGPVGGPGTGPENGPGNLDEPIADTAWSPYDEVPEYGSQDAATGAPAGGPAGGAGADRPDPKAAWSDAGERLGGLGSKLRRHYEEQSGTSGPEAGAEVKDAAKKLGEAVQNAFEALGSAAKDPEVKDDVRQVGRSVSDALAGTLAGLSGELRKTFGRDEPRDPGKPKDPGTPA